MKQILTLILVGITHFSFATFYSGGSGTVADPYQIANKSDLQYLSEHPAHWGYHFIQTADIVFTASDFAVGGDFYNGGEGFIPIGLNSVTPFVGTYIGDEYTIDSLYINRPSQNYIGLFGYVRGSNAEINALNVTHATIIGDEYIGILIGQCDSATVIECFVSGTAAGQDSYVAGLCGYAAYESIERCEADVQITGLSDLGGLIGFNYLGTVTTCNTRGTINGDYLLGGLIGRLVNNSTVSNCYSTCTVNGGEFAGGLVGYQDNSLISNCYATGAVTGTSDLGGLIGLNDGTVQQSFWDTESTGQSTSQGGTAKTSLEMKTEATFTNGGWDFIAETANGTTDIWQMGECENNGYPVFYWQPSTAYPEVSFGSLNGNLLDSATICYDGSATIHASSWDNVTWHDSITSASEVSNTSSYTTPNLTSTTMYYAQADNGTCVNPFRLAFTVVVRPENVTNQTLEFCGSGSVTVGNNTYTSTGIYTDVFTDVHSCDSTIITTLTIHPDVNTGTTLNDLTITALESGATYQWINCATNSPILGETAQTFTATANGSYAVIVSNGNCSDTSACVTITTVGLSSLEYGNLVVYPNPGSGLFNIELENSGSEAKSLKITDVLGNEIYSRPLESDFTIDLSNEPNGVYFILLSSENNTPIVRRIIKE